MKNLKKLTTVFMVMAMVLGLALGYGSPRQALAADSSDAFITSKTAELQEDGTYKITLEGYATGEEVRSTVTEHVPSDIVLVLDVSGSMDDELAVGSTTSLDSLDKNQEDGTYYFYYRAGVFTHKYPLRYKNGQWQYKPYYGTSYVNIVGSNYEDEILDGSLTVYVKKIDALKIAVNSFIDQINADCTANNVAHNIAIVTYATSATTVKDLTDASSAANVTALKSAVSGLEANGSTAADYGFEKANAILKASANNGHSKTVVMFTDGEPNHSSGFNTTVANSTITNANTSKNTYGANVYTVGLYSSASDNMTKYMNYVSSNYPAATSMTASGAKAADNYYQTTNDSLNLNAIFETIAKDTISGGAAVKADATTVMKDIISSEFTLPASGQVKAYTVDVNATASNENKALTFATAKTAVNVTANVSGNNVEVSGFDFSANWCGKDADGNYRGKKLVVEITGILPTTAAFTGSAVDTNATGSGVWSDTKELEEFTKPSVTLLNKAVVVDYAKKLALTANTDSPIGLKTVSKFLNNSAVSAAVPTATYGDLTLEGSALYYTPKSTSWTGTDTIYTFGKNAADQNTWSKATVVPATNVYYEDSFTGVAAGGKASITYTGSWTTAVTAGDNAGSTTADGVDGWVEALETETGYTDGTAMVADLTSEDATATINFTGTGIDVYTKTNAKSGVIVATLTSADDNLVMNAKLTKVYNESESGTYYSVPTLSYSNLTYGNYKLTIVATVDSKTEAKKQYEYNIDGIRIYNPGSANTAKFVTLNQCISDTSLVFVDHVNGVKTVTDAKSVKNNGLGDMAQYEIYLKENACISFKVSDLTQKYYIGMKSLDGSKVNATFSAGYMKKSTTEFTHTADMYYEVTPDKDGVITIANTGAGILSLTKLQIVGDKKYDVSVTPVAGDSAANVADLFDSYDTVTYMAAPVSFVAEAAQENSSLETIKEPEVTITAPDVEIVEADEEVAEAIEEIVAPTDAAKEKAAKWTTFIKTVKKLFGR